MMMMIQFPPVRCSDRRAHITIWTGEPPWTRTQGSHCNSERDSLCCISNGGAHDKYLRHESSHCTWMWVPKLWFEWESVAALHLDGYEASGAWQAASCVPFFWAYVDVRVWWACLMWKRFDLKVWEAKHLNLVFWWCSGLLWWQKEWEDKHFVGMLELVRTIFSLFWNQCFLEHENGLCWCNGLLFDYHNSRKWFLLTSQSPIKVTDSSE